MKRMYFDEYVFEFIWNNADRDGLWSGDEASLATEFQVSEDRAYRMLSTLCERGSIQKVLDRTYIVVNWPESNEHREEDQHLQ